MLYSLYVYINVYILNVFTVHLIYSIRCTCIQTHWILSENPFGKVQRCGNKEKINK